MGKIPHGNVTQLCYNTSAVRVFDFLYPRLYCLDPNDSTWGTDGDFIPLPPRLPLSGASLSNDRVFLLTGMDG